MSNLSTHFFSHILYIHVHVDTNIYIDTRAPSPLNLVYRINVQDYTLTSVPSLAKGRNRMLPPSSPASGQDSPGAKDVKSN